MPQYVSTSEEIEEKREEEIENVNMYSNTGPDCDTAPTFRI